VEVGQLVVLAVAVPALGFLFKYVVPERIGTIILSALVAHTAWHWMTERGAELAQHPWPVVDAAALSTALWWGMAAVAVGAMLWLFSGLVRSWQLPREGEGDRAAPPRAS
jgi:TRAP-type C4-dicarboxylate transport system permease small subunit